MSHASENCVKGHFRTCVITVRKLQGASDNVLIIRAEVKIEIGCAKDGSKKDRERKIEQIKDSLRGRNLCALIKFNGDPGLHHIALYMASFIN